MDINTDFKENSYQEDVISEAYQRPSKSYFQDPLPLDSQINAASTKSYPVSF